MNVDNCKYCGKVYMKNPRGFCNDCFKTITEQSTRCNDLLRKSMISLADLSKSTGISEDRIFDLLKAGFVKPIRGLGLKMVCSSCGGSSYNSRLCTDCEKQLKSRGRY